jgi:carbon storage regulator
MLVLSRQRDETIMIGDEIEITVVDIRGDKVRLGITAPSRIAVHRKEVYEAIRAENQRASMLSKSDLTGIRPAANAGIGKTSAITPVGGETPSITVGGEGISPGMLRDRTSGADRSQHTRTAFGRTGTDHGR